jgi:hypothetical protein
MKPKHNNYILGFSSFGAFFDSLVSPKYALLILSLSSVLATIASLFENAFGFSPVIGLLSLVLFIIEVRLGIKSSQGGYDSKRFPAGFIKLGIYYLFIAAFYMCSVYIPPKSGWIFQFNVFEYLHYIMINFLILNLLLSIVESLIKLGYDEKIPILKTIAKLLKINTDKLKNLEK